MKITEVRNMSDAELQTELENVRRRIFELRSQAVTEKLEDTTLISKAKRDVARILSVINERRAAK